MTDATPLKRPKRKWDAASLQFAATLVVAAIFLAPLLRVGTIGDDLVGSFLHGALGFRHMTLWQAIVENTQLWLGTQGRFFPFTVLYGYPFFDLTHGSSVAEKTLQLSAILVNIATLFLLVRRMAGAQAASIAAIVLVGLFQVRFWYDPIAGWVTLMPVVVESTLLASWLWLVAFDRRSRLIAAAAALVELAGLLSYELSYGMALAIALVAWQFAPDRRWRWTAIASIFGLVVALTAADLILRRFASGISTNYAFKGGGGILESIGLEIVAALPWSYAIARPFPAIMPPLGTMFTSPTLYSVVPALSATGLSFAALNRSVPAGESAARRSLTDLAGFGLILWLVPAAIISLSPRWRSEIGPGLGYLNVYAEYYGVAAIAGAALTALFCRPAGSRTRRAGATGAVAVAIGVLFYITAQSNGFSYAAWRPIYTDGRINADRALRAGLFAAAPENSVVMLDSSYVFPVPETQYLLYQDTGKRFSIGTLAQAESGELCVKGRYVGSGCRARPNIWQYRSTTFDTQTAWVQGEHSVAFDHTGPTLYARTDHVFIFATDPFARRAGQLGARLVRSVPNGALYEFTDCLTTPAVNFSIAGAPHLIFGSGFYAPEGDAFGTFAWASKTAILMLDNSSDRAADAHVAGLASMLGSGVVQMQSGSTTRSLRFDTAPRAFDLPVHLPAHRQTQVTFMVLGALRTAPGDRRQLGVRIDGAHLTGLACGHATGEPAAHG